MISSLIYLIGGTVTLRIAPEHKEKVLSFITERSVRFRALRDLGEDGISFEVTLSVFKRLSVWLDCEKISYTHSNVGGIPRLYKKYGRRFGAFIGIIIFSVTVWTSGRRVWYMEVVGNSGVEDSEILDNLEKIGFTYGTPFKSVDLDYLRNTYLMTYDDLSWISINMRGTHATIEVRELSDPEKEDTKSAGNVVAAESGNIVLVESYEGRPVVFPGDHVEKGQLIISGLITDGEDTLRLERADGVVLAEVMRTFTVNVPKKREVKVYTGREKRENSLDFFKKNIKLSGKCGILDSSYDTIKKRSQLCLFHTTPLPIFFESTVYREYTLDSVPMTDREIKEASKAAYSAKLGEALCGAELIEERITEYDTDDMRVMACRIICLADISEKTDIGLIEQ